MAYYVDIHVIQTIPYANLNRDAEGSPKALVFGGADRTRVSSQSWKRAIRHDLEEQLGEKAARTRLLPLKVAEILVSVHGWPQELADLAGAQVVESTNKAKDALKTEPNGATSALLYLPDSAAAAIAELCVEFREALEAHTGKKKAGALLPADRVTALIQGKTATINLFGRMLAEIPGSNVDGAVQIAHAFTTHESDSQRDFFTAVDDWLDPDKATGAGHMSTAEFSAGVFYRFATVNVQDLVTNLDADRVKAQELVEMFLEHFIMSLPQAKKNSTAPHTVPDLVYVVVRDGRPVSGAAAFEKPVRRQYDSGIAEPSIEAFARYMEKIDQLIGSAAKRYCGYATVAEKELAALGQEQASFRALVEGAGQAAFEQHKAGV
jgi:CRISPR system Cascade subunit CasC